MKKQQSSGFMKLLVNLPARPKEMYQPRAIGLMINGTSGSMKNISKSSFLKVQIPKVSQSEQQEFASKIEAIEKQKELIKQSIAETEMLFNSRMDYYFN